MTIIGELCIQKGGIRQFFTTKNTLTPPDRIDLSLVEGPFKSLEVIGASKLLDQTLVASVWNLNLNSRAVWSLWRSARYSRKLLAA